jgi:DNA-binding response OmpR family regulator
MNTSGEHPIGTVLVIEDDRDIGDLVERVLTGEGFVVSLFDGGGPDAIHAAVARFEPDCILLDGESPLGYGASWAEAAWIATRDPAVPVIMFTGHAAAIREAEDNTSVRSQVAGFAAVLPKPFDLDHLIATVTQAVRSGR